MKLVQITFQVQYTDQIGEILRAIEPARWVTHSRVAGRDSDGRHEGSQAFPGSLALAQAVLPNDAVTGLLEALRTFREEKRAHRHLQAVVLPVEDGIGTVDEDDDRGAQ